MLDPGLYLAYVAACIAIIVVPGPNVTVIAASALRDGTRAGLQSVAGTQLGLLLVLTGLAIGVAQIAEHLAAIFEVIRWVGAIYLIWLGIKLWRSNGDLGRANSTRPARGYFWQGFVVVLCNPKVLLFFGAFIPQFIDPAGDAFIQTMILGATFIAVAAVLDSGYAIAAGTAGNWLTRSNVRIVERLSGTCLIGGGIWLALARRAP